MAARAAAPPASMLRKLAGWATVAPWLYVKLTHLPPGAVASAVNDIRAGVHPIAALATVAGKLGTGPSASGLDS